MKTLKIAIVSIFTFLSLASNNSYAGVFESKWTEPLLLGALGSVLAIAAAPADGDPTQYGSIGFAAGAGLGWGINSYYENKYEARYIQNMNDLKKKVDLYQQRDAQRASTKDMKTRYGVIVQEYVEPQDLGNGQVTSGYIIERHTTPNNIDAFVGE